MPKGIYLHKSGKEASGYINGNSFKKYSCKQCKAEISRFSAIYGSGLCKSCATKIRTQGTNNPNFGNHKLNGKFIGINATNFKNGTYSEYIKHYCKCGKKIKGTSKRCNSCNIKFLFNSGKISTKGKNNPMYGKVTHGKWSKYKGIWMRSSWEVAYAKYLDKNHIRWLYESKTFDLGNTTYTPDFYLPESDTYVEIKGWWRDDAKKKFRLFKKIYNKIMIEIYDENKIKKERII